MEPDEVTRAETPEMDASSTPRCGSPEMFFANEFDDSDDEEEDTEEVRKASSITNPLPAQSDSSGINPAVVGHFLDQENVFKEEPGQRLDKDDGEVTHISETDTEVTARMLSQPQKSKNGDNQTVVVAAAAAAAAAAGGGGGGGGGIATAVDNDDDFEIIRENIEDQGPTEDLFDSGWELSDEDLMCLPLVLSQSRIEEYKKLKLAGSSDTSQRPYSDGGQKGKCIRMMMKKAGKGSTRIVYTSPLTMVANIAKQNGYDLPTLMETSEFMFGPSYQLPCMQCYGKPGGKASAMLGSSMLTQTGSGSSNGRCPSCGGQVQSLASYGTMIRQMRDMIEAKNLVPYDVYPDGNCLFAAIVDQLRVRGDFSFTPHSLRQSAVRYLRENPNADDDTPLHLFLTDDESWESYLTRMSLDGEWGDHMVISALVNVIDRPIVIFGGMSGQRETILIPKRLTAAAAESEDGMAEEENAIYLGHIGESHYMSLRPKLWRQSLQDGLRKRFDALKLGVPDGNSLTPCPIQHINFILRQVFRMNLVKNYSSKFIEMMETMPTLGENRGVKSELTGSMICKMVPGKMKCDTLGPDISMFFPSIKQDSAGECVQKPTLVCFSIPSDTNVLPNFESSKIVDVIAEDDTASIGRIKLIPKVPKLWKGQTKSVDKLDVDTVYLKTFDIDLKTFSEMVPETITEEVFDMYRTISFKCSWPDKAKEWKERGRVSHFPDPHTVQTVVANGCHVVPLTSNSKMADVLDDPVHFVASFDDHTWCYSFATAEKEICRFMSDEQRQCFLIFKDCIDSTLRNIPLQSAVVKSIFFYACEKIEVSLWKQKPGQCLFILLKKITECFKIRNVPHYFMREKNLLQFIPQETIAECYSRLYSIQLQPVVTLYFLLDHMNIFWSEIGLFLEEVIESINLNGDTSTKDGPSSSMFIPAYKELLKNLIYEEDYAGALLVFQDIIEGKSGTIEKGGFALINELWDVPIGYLWCFALYVDFKLKTTLSSQLCKNYDAVHVTEVFGPDWVKELPDTIVPECFGIPSGDLKFLAVVSDVLMQTVSNKTYVKCTKYYLKQYAEIAGDALVIDYELAHSTTKTRNSKYTPTDLTLYTLQDIYAAFYNFCSRNYLKSEFKDLMPSYEKIAERLGTRTTLRNLSIMWESFGEHEKASEVSKRMDDGKGQYMIATIMGNFLDGDGY